VIGFESSRSDLIGVRDPASEGVLVLGTKSKIEVILRGSNEPEVAGGVEFVRGGS
jgi:hypothetical protein